MVPWSELVIRFIVVRASNSFLDREQFDAHIPSLSNKDTLLCNIRKWPSKQLDDSPLLTIVEAALGSIEAGLVPYEVDGFKHQLFSTDGSDLDGKSTSKGSSNLEILAGLSNTVEMVGQCLVGARGSIDGNNGRVSSGGVLDVRISNQITVVLELWNVLWIVRALWWCLPSSVLGGGSEIAVGSAARVETVPVVTSLRKSWDRFGWNVCWNDVWKNWGTNRATWGSRCGWDGHRGSWSR